MRSYAPALTLAALALAFARGPPPAPPAFPDAEHLPSRPEMPDPLVALDGTRVTTPADWFAKRRPELKALFQHYMYGQMPPAPGKVAGKVEREDGSFLGGKATLKEITLT